MNNTHVKLKHKKLAFTLAEVLITLGIIGVVAALTIPTLMQNSDDQATVSALTKTYSTLSQAYTLAVKDNGSPDSWGFTPGSKGPFLTTLVPYLKIDKDCTDGSSGCFPASVSYNYLAPSLGSGGTFDQTPTDPKLRLADGTLIKVANIYSGTCKQSWGSSQALDNICGEYVVDVNGYKDPNQYGKDTFVFYLTDFGIVPAGSPLEQGQYGFPNLTGCHDANTTYGTGCAAWVIYNKNRDYLKCNTLAWGGKTKC